ncbi:MAG: glycosyltransferase [Bryobacteraceae bacterium]|nr:glycosyltransferase [Bryobacteraceae bacterium]
MQRSQHLAKALVKRGHVCLYINPHLGLEYPTPPLCSPRSRVSSLSPGILELHIHLPAEHGVTSRALHPSEVKQVVHAVGSLMNELELKRAVQIVSLPSWLDVVATLRNEYGFPIIYDCHDYLPGFHRLAPEIIEAEPFLLHSCDQVIFSAQYLMDLQTEKAPAVTSKALLLRNASDPRHFVAQREPRKPRERRRIGYIGSLDHWLDLELLEAVVAVNRHFDFVLAGRMEDSRLLQLRRFPNVELTGEIPYSSIPAFLQNCDVGIIPFCRTPLTLSANPIKMYEYFSAGLPVVSTRLPEVELYRELVYVADTATQFGKHLERAVHERDAGLREQRIATAERETWENRATAFLDYLDLCPFFKSRSSDVMTSR